MNEKLNMEPPINNWNNLRNVRVAEGSLGVSSSALVVVVHVCWQAMSLFKEVRFIFGITGSRGRLCAVELCRQGDFHQ